jgi:GNAT superfamily N-acetyltransferase
VEIEMNTNELSVVTWKELGDDGIDQIYAIEKQTWAPWLAAGHDSLAGRAVVNPLGQLAVVDGGGVVLASLSTNQIEWSGAVDELPSWDDVAGDPTDYSQTYVPEGNTTVLMSMNVHPEAQGQKLPAQLVKTVCAQAAQSPSVQRVIGSFRPSEFALATKQNPELDFADYVATVRHDGLPVDKWLRVLTRMGMEQLAVDDTAMKVYLGSSEMEQLRTSQEQATGEPWIKLRTHGPGSKYWCGETGFFYDLRKGGQVYIESNVWGMLWQRGDDE